MEPTEPFNEFGVRADYPTSGTLLKLLGRMINYCPISYSKVTPHDKEQGVVAYKYGQCDDPNCPIYDRAIGVGGMLDRQTLGDLTAFDQAKKAAQREAKKK